jgi:hypothetical protein
VRAGKKEKGGGGEVHNSLLSFFLAIPTEFHLSLLSPHVPVYSNPRLSLYGVRIFETYLNSWRNLNYLGSVNNGPDSFPVALRVELAQETY